MQREIKFRAWHIKDKKMHDVSCVYFYDNKIVVSMPLHIHGFEMLCKECVVGDIELMQYTGLKDKNGKDIYEGDILEEETGYYFEVVWDEKYSKFKLQWKTKAYQYPEWNRGINMRIIGNIYGNPELLEVSE